MALVALVARIWRPGQDVMLDEPAVVPVEQPAEAGAWAQGHAGALLGAYLDGLAEVTPGTWRLEVLYEATGHSPATAHRDV